MRRQAKGINHPLRNEAQSKLMVKFTLQIAAWNLKLLNYAGLGQDIFYFILNHLSRITENYEHVAGARDEKMTERKYSALRLQFVA